MTADQFDTFLHGDQPETAAAVSHGGHVEALAVVHHRKVELLALAAQRHCHLLRAAVEDAVTQRFLRDAKEADRDVGVNGADAVRTGELDLAPVPLCDLLAMRAQRRGEAQQAKRRRMEVVRQAADALERVACLAIELGDALLHFRILEGTGGVLQAADAHRHRGQPLADVVVQIAGDLGARRFLRVDQAARHLPNALVARVQRRFPRPDRGVGPAQA